MQVKLSKLLDSAKADEAEAVSKKVALEQTQAEQQRRVDEATAAKATADEAASKTRRAFAGAIAAKGGTFVDTSATPLVQYVTNTDGTDYLTKSVAGPDDTFDDGTAEPEPAPTPPPEPVAPAPAPEAEAAPQRRRGW